jgi:tripartite-type tricarboxylate transporter receptor subunit TctC
MITSQQPIVVAMYDNLNYDLIRDFAPISLIGTTPLMLITNVLVPANSVKELVALAKSRPGEMNYGSPGSGSSGHLAAEVFSSMAGIRITHVPYKGTPQALNDMIANQVQLTFLVAPAAMPFVKAGKVKALAVTTPKRSPLAPEIPAMGETLPGYEWSGWYGLVAPAKTPQPIIAKLNAAQVNAIRSGDLRERLLDLGATPVGSTPEEYGAHLRRQVERMRDAIRISGAKRD